MALGGEIADLLEDFAALEKAVSQSDKGLQFDRTDFGAILLVLRALSRVYVFSNPVSPWRDRPQWG